MDAYEENLGQGVSDQTPSVIIQIIGAKVKEMKVQTMVTTTERINVCDMETIPPITSSTGKSVVRGRIVFDHMFILRIKKVLLRKVEVVCRGLRI